MLLLPGDQLCMPFIRFRKVKYTKDGKIASGSASIIDTTYITVNGKKRGKQKTREKLGKVIEVFSKKSGIFLSPTRGLVRYDSETDSFSKSLNKDECIQNITNKKIEKKLFPSKNVHTIFGDAYLFLEMLKKIGLLDLIKICFSRRNELERILAHQLYSLLRNESKISCEDFVNRSFFSYCINNISSGSLRSDSRFFYLMSDDKLKIKFFSNFIKLMKKEYPNFGTGCYIDSTPLPNDISSPFNALCSHGLGEASIQMRLILIIDDISLYPIWYTIIPGNIQDFNTLRQLIDDVNASLDVKIKNFVLDAGYATKELIQSFQAQKEGEEIPERRYLTRMPGKKGYPYKELYTKSKKDFSSGTYDFLREDGAYFGKKVDVKIFETDLKAYIYVDQRNALYGYINFLKNNYGDVEKMKKK